ncbi:MAG: NAD(P)/FAD-dependent oxidoreductase, partial [Vulcanisaeta sp.]
KLKALGVASTILHMLLNKSLGESLRLMSGLSIRVDDYDNHIDAILTAALRRPWAFIKAVAAIIQELSETQYPIHKLLRSLIE